MRLIANNYEPNEIIRIIREWTGLTQEQFAKEINRSVRTVQGYEAGKIDYNVKMLLEVAKKHNIHITIEKK